MTTRSHSKMATNTPESQEFDVNNQLGIEGLEEDTTPNDNTSAEDAETRAGRQMSQPREMNFQMLVKFVRQQDEEMSRYEI